MPLIVYAKKNSQETADEEGADEDAGDEEQEKKREEKKNKENEKLNDQIREDESAIKGAQSEKEQMKSSINDVEKIISSLESQKGDLEGYVRQLDGSLSEIQNEINGLNDKIETLDGKLEDMDVKIASKEEETEAAKKELERAQKELESSYNDTKQHIKYMYETRNATILDILLSSRGVKDLLNRATYVTSMAGYAKEKLDEYARFVELVEVKKAGLEEQQKELSDLKGEMEEMKEEITGQKAQVKAKEDDVSKLISAKEQEINIYNADILSKEQQIEEYKKQIAEQDSIIKALEASIAKRRAQLEAGVSGNEAEGPRRYDGGKFTFPAPSYTRISDDYGNRIHPILGIERFHNGVDLAAPSGSPILAAYDGTVIAAAYSSSMGNYIMIDHGDDLYTIYMHASSLLVSNGASVSKGQKIALVGSTGRSTGPHLHFSVRQGGNYVSPWNYLK